MAKWLGSCTCAQKGMGLNLMIASGTTEVSCLLLHLVNGLTVAVHAVCCIVFRYDK